MVINGLEHDHLLQVSKHGRSKLFFLLLVKILRILNNHFFQLVSLDSIFFHRGDRPLERKLFINSVLKSFEIPVFWMFFFIRIKINEPFTLLLNHLRHSVFQVFTGQDFSPLGIDHFSLFVHDIIVFQQMLPDFEIMGLHFPLSALNGFGNKSVFDGLIFFNS